MDHVEARYPWADEVRMVAKPGDCYVAIKPCGCAVAATVIVEDHEKDTAKDVALFIRKGLRVEIKSVEWVRENLRRCTHPAEKTKP